MCDAAAIMRIRLQMWRRSRVARVSQQVMQDNGDLWVSGGGAANAPHQMRQRICFGWSSRRVFGFVFFSAVLKMPPPLL